MATDLTDWRRALAGLAMLTGGAAVLCDQAGGVLAVAGAGAPKLVPRVPSLVRAASTDVPAVVLHQADGSHIAVVRVGVGVLIIDDSERIAEVLRYRKVVEDSLPFVAQVAGGDAIMFDRDGTRTTAYHPNGKFNPAAVGTITEFCRKAMQECRPSIGMSVMNPGALAVRVPLAPDFGLAFNNKLATTQRNRLLERAQQHQTARYHLEDIIGDGAAIQKAKKLAASIASSPSTVLIHGETGTGKELFAQAIHNLSPRAAKPFVAINCGALPPNLVESTLFGYADGAFTGARKRGASGVFEQAHGGTLFLDEIGEMPFDLQPSLLRVIQEHEVRRVGAETTLPVDVRIIASTNNSLEDLVRHGKFRADLFFRLHVIELHVPPLRERKEDIPLLAYHFITRSARTIGKEANDIDPALIAAICDYDWPGNVRELQNCAEYLVTMADGSGVRREHLPASVLGPTPVDAEGGSSPYRTSMATAERDLVAQAMQSCGGNKSDVARRLGLNRTTLWRILKRLDLDTVRQPRADGIDEHPKPPGTSL
jgi:DNA-binding NtrC family response regulator